MKKLLILLTAVAFFASCSDDDEKIVPKDYGMKKFSADMKYEKPKGMAKDFSCKQQVYMQLGKEKAVHTGIYGLGSWTTFNILPEIPKSMGSKEMIKNPKYNVTTTVKDWDILFTQYVGNAMKGRGDGVFPYFLAGVLINPERVEVALHEYTASKEEKTISEAFSKLMLSDVATVKYSNEIDAIGTAWKGMKGMPPTYNPQTNFFYIIKTKSGDIYKLRFVGVYGKTQDERIFSCEYALMK
ncbi:MAG: hypothetical protein KGV44_15560 [Flavobacteriaceae bacterium]|nr:hypothetical protein [Flavobacteriaceae bacterium]